MNTQMMQRIAEPGFIAALDQSGGSTPGALKAYGIPDTAYANDEEMFALMHAMRVRIMTSKAFSGAQILAAILFERTMDAQAGGLPVPTYLWQEKTVIPFLKVDKGLESLSDGVSLMKPIPTLRPLLDRARQLGVFGTKMRSTIALASSSGIQAIVDQQIAVANEISEAELVPILEPEVLISSPERGAAEAILLEKLLKGLDRLPAQQRVMIKLTLPEEVGLYAPLVAHSSVIRVVALSGGFARQDACARLRKNRGMIASFSRALIGDLRADMNDATFEATLGNAVREIYDASVSKKDSPAAIARS